MLWVLFLLVAWGAAVISCARLCLVSARTGLLSGASMVAVRDTGAGHELTLYETAFLAAWPPPGGRSGAGHHASATTAAARPHRLGNGRRPGGPGRHGAHGDPCDRPAGPVPDTADTDGRATADAVRALADRLVAAGLALPGGAGTDVAAAVRAVRGAALLVVAMGVVTLLMPGQEHGPGGPLVSLLVRFGLPLALTVGCLAIARMEIHPYSSWASPAGQRLLAENDVPAAGADRDILAAIAVRGVRAVDDPALRAALGGGPGGPLR